MVPGTGDRADPGGVASGQLTVGLRVGLDPPCRAWRYFAGDPGRDPDGEHSVRDGQPRRDRADGGDQRPAADDRTVEHGGAVAYQCLRVDGRAVDHAQMADGGSLADLGDGAGAAMQDRAVLHVGAAPHDNRPEICPEHRPVPDGRPGLDVYVPDEGGSGRDPGFGADVRLAALKGEQWHPPIMPPNPGPAPPGPAPRPTPH